jgi:wyosine [tRNA(Phe)-imidazoG37] synthetase (radical SAM superfamily)
MSECECEPKCEFCQCPTGGLDKEAVERIKAELLEREQDAKTKRIMEKLKNAYLIGESVSYATE